MKFDDLLATMSPTRAPDVATGLLADVPPVLPLRAFYARERGFESRRARFYAHIAREFGSPGWRLKAPNVATRASNSPGRGGRKRDIQKPDRKTSVVTDLSLSVVGWIIATDEMNDPVKRTASDAEKTAAHHWGEIRRRTAVRLRDLHAKATGEPLKSVDWMAEPSGQAGPKMLSPGKLEALDTIGRVRQGMPPACMDLIERDIFNDEFTFALESKVARQVALEDLRFALDFAAYRLGGQGMDRDRLISRWWPVAGNYLMLRPAIELARQVKKAG